MASAQPINDGAALIWKQRADKIELFQQVPSRPCACYDTETIIRRNSLELEAGLVVLKRDTLKRVKVGGISLAVFALKNGVEYKVDVALVYCFCSRRGELR